MKFLGIYIGYKNQHKILYILCLLLLLLFLYLSFIKPYFSPRREGFTQDLPFLMKHDNEIFDDFLAEIYNKIHQPRGPNQYIFDIVEKNTQPSKEKSVILDAGCGTGELLGYLHEKRYKYVYGVDLSQKMVEYCQEKWPNVNIKHGNVLIPMTYDKNTFTHIFMTGDTFYHIEDKLTALRNLYYWLSPHGYLILQLYDPMKWNPIPLSGRPLLVNSVQDYSNDRITNSTIDFVDFVFSSMFDFSKWDSTKKVIYQETFVDADTKNIRKNEIDLFMNPINDIISLCKYAGFLVHGQINMSDSPLNDPNQYIFILQRPM